MVKLLLKHRSSASEGPKVQLLIGTQNFSLSQACDNTKSIFFPWIKFMTVWEHRFAKSNWIIIIAIVMGSNRDHELLFFVCSWVILTAGKHLSLRRRKTLEKTKCNLTYSGTIFNRWNHIVFVPTVNVMINCTSYHLIETLLF